ncbi:hypothetical protein N7491_007625 [Penicillium cf. griseofulvum]|uniref:Ankyrin repeat domain-containing protein n=1 Tax=Penicillium cf. griseofulvum TaxID=2972120 RepID=A0A9W9M0V5_9EURO|nr:hypothetical protein N7472_009349 [Penicillium cf. griseofulvum]KAJ5430609.1 hypothetical protein N7491_007625 [Penicillium cf. griseofulvum]KAJ5435622.1 hypothetical protein N7445_006507 [Penicillium cf. griseofulvum]
MRHKSVELLLNKGADVSAQGGRYGNALYAASGGGYQEIVRSLIDKREPPRREAIKRLSKSSKEGALLHSLKRSVSRTPTNPAKRLRLMNFEPSAQTE